MQRLRLALIATALATLGTQVMSIEPTFAAEITFDTEAEIAGSLSFSSFFISAIEDELNVTLPSESIPFAEEFSDRFTIDDDPNQYLDGDISLGWKSFLSEDLWLDFGGIDFSLLESFLDIDFGGTGLLTNGIEDLAFTLSYDSVNKEFISTFTDFDPDNNFIDSCLIGVCTATADFEFSLFFNQGFPLEVVSAAGNFAITTTPVGSSQSVPEPTLLLGLLGIGGCVASQRRKLHNS